MKVYVLLNHNGTVLARHTRVEALIAEMKFYEAHTGNKTSICVEGGA